MSDRDRWDLRGAVRTLETERSSVEFHPDGSLAHHSYRNPDGSESTSAYSYDDTGRHPFFSVTGAPIITSTYNQDGRPTESLLKDQSGALLGRIDYSYDESGNLTEEVHTRTHGFPLPANALEKLNPAQREAIRDLLNGPAMRLLHRYDALGRKIETRSSVFGSLSNDRIVMAYSEYGDIVSEITDSESRDYGFNSEEGPLEAGPVKQNRSENRFRYEYDARGNWISKVIESGAGDNPEFAVTHTEHRTLTYFDPI
jgi:YD repeat-containing protein